MAMAVRLADGTVIGAGSGYSEPSGKEAWSVDTVAAIGSVTKTFTAVVVMQLVEEGKLSLDDTIDTCFLYDVLNEVTISVSLDAKRSEKSFVF